MQIVNLTPHPLTLIGEDGTTTDVAPKPEGPAARLAEQTTPLAPLRTDDGQQLPLTRVTASDQSPGLPEPQPGVVLVVSRLLALAYPEREDLVFPYQEVRDEGGRIIGARGFGTIHA